MAKKQTNKKKIARTLPKTNILGFYGFDLNLQ